MDLTPIRILAIDPGSERSAWLGLADGLPTGHGIVPNAELLDLLRDSSLVRELGGTLGTVVVIEQIEPRYGLQMGWETLDTARWVGCFQEAVHPTPVVLLKRSEILRHLGVVTSPRKGEKRVSADSGVRQALLDLFGGERAKGTKAGPGPLYGVSKDVWSALAVAVTYAATGGER